MNKSTIDMAREVYGAHTEWTGAPFDRLEQLVALVRAAEREACAKVCESKAETMAITGKSCDPDDLAAAIRARLGDRK
jgi:hypothetical protein